MDVSIDIAAPDERVWAVIADVERWPEWTSTMSDVKLLEATALALGVRVRIKQPKLPTTVWEVTRFEPGRGFSWTAKAPGMTTVGEHWLTDENDGHVRATLGIRRSGALGPLADVVFRRITDQYVRTEAESLKRRCETGA